MPTILMSYRPEDSPRDAVFLQDKLQAAFGKGRALLGIGPVEPGEDRLDVIEGKLKTCDTMLCLIGLSWLAAKEGGRRRLDNPEDPVRLEIAAALRLAAHVRVVVALLGGSRMPLADDLPPDLTSLAECYSYPIRDESYGDDVELLITALGHSARASGLPPLRPQASSAKPPDASPPPGPSTFDVFISYNSDDMDYVRDICRELEQRGIYPWCAEMQLRAGDDWLTEVDKHIRSINAVAVIVGNRGLGDYQPQEINKYLDKRKRTGCPVIPVLLPDTDPVEHLPFYLTGFTWADFRKDSKDKGDQFAKLVRALKPELAARQSEPRAPSSFSVSS
jgi:hypothetical protein